MTKKNDWISQFFITAMSCFSINLIAQNQVDFTTTASAAHEESYPQRYLDRPSVMPMGTMNMDLGTNLSHPETVGGDNHRERMVGVDFAAKFGIINGLEGMFSYDGLKFNNVKHPQKRTVERTINLGAKLHYLSVSHLSGSLTAKMPIHILDGEILRSVVIGIPMILYSKSMAAGIFSDLLNFTMRKEIEAELNFKIWYGIQMGDHLWAELNSSFGKINVTNPDNQAEVQTKGIWQELPLSLAAIYAFNNAFDIGANFGVDNAMKAADTMNFGLTLSYRVGRLFGQSSHRS